jgi:hypothetical protein
MADTPDSATSLGTLICSDTSTIADEETKEYLKQALSKFLQLTSSFSKCQLKTESARYITTRQDLKVQIKTIQSDPPRYEARITGKEGVVKKWNTRLHSSELKAARELRTTLAKKKEISDAFKSGNERRFKAALKR